MCFPDLLEVVTLLDQIQRISLTLHLMNAQILYGTIPKHILNLELDFTVQSQQIDQVFLIDLYHGAAEFGIGVHLGKHLFHYGRHEAIIIAEHSESFAAARAAVGEDSSIIALDELVRHIFPHNFVNLLLNGVRCT